MFPRIIAVEGPDGVGKSTFCASLAATLGDLASAQKTPPGDLFKLARQAGQPGSLGAFFAFMVGNAIISQAELSRRWLILDRYLLSTFVYHADAIAKAQIDFQLVSTISSCRPPVITVLLECPAERIHARLAEREEAQANPKLNDTLNLSAAFVKAIYNPLISPYLGRLLRLQNVTRSDMAESLARVTRIISESD